jgi:hypothetical protein
MTQSLTQCATIFDSMLVFNSACYISYGRGIFVPYRHINDYSRYDLFDICVDIYTSLAITTSWPIFMKIIFSIGIYLSKSNIVFNKIMIYRCHGNPNGQLMVENVAIFVSLIDEAIH